MKVLTQNRPDAFDRWGGDTTQMQETANHLRKLDVEVDISLENSISLDKYDLIHIFNIQTARTSINQINNAKEQNKKIVLSTIYWDAQQANYSDDVLRFSPSPRIRKVFTLQPKLAKAMVKYSYQKLENQMKEMLISADLLLPNSIAEIEALVYNFGLDIIRQKSLVVYNAVYIDKTITIDENTSMLLETLPKEFVLECASIYPVKGQLSLIKALYDHTEIPIVFAGSSANNLYYQACRKLAQTRGNIFFIDHIKQNQLQFIQKHAKVHVLPSLRESPGLATLEAAVYGANCVVGKYAPVEEYFGEDAWVCDPMDISSIKDAVLNAWEAPHSDNFKNRILQDFTWEKAALATLEAYKTIIGKVK